MVVFAWRCSMVGVRPEPRRGHPMSWVCGLYPSLPVYATGELIRHFQAQVDRADAEAGSRQGASDAGRLCRGKEAQGIMAHHAATWTRCARNTSSVHAVFHAYTPPPSRACGRSSPSSKQQQTVARKQQSIKSTSSSLIMQTRFLFF